MFPVALPTSELIAPVFAPCENLPPVALLAIPPARASAAVVPIASEPVKFLNPPATLFTSGDATPVIAPSFAPSLNLPPCNTLETPPLIAPPAALLRAPPTTVLPSAATPLPSALLAIFEPTAPTALPSAVLASLLPTAPSAVPMPGSAKEAIVLNNG